MRDLRLSDCITVTDLKQNFINTKLICVDSEHQVLICATSEQICFFNITSFQIESCIPLPFNDDKSTDSEHALVSLHYIHDLCSVCIARNSGEIILCNNDGEVQFVANLVSGIESVAWNNDQDLAILANRQSLFAMSRDFELLNEVPINPSQFGEANRITVGWGSKSTQFHGSEGKQAALQQTPEFGDQLLPSDVGTVALSWRGDGQYIAVSSMDNGRRIIRVWTRDLILHSTCEVTACLDHNIHWKPSGSYIASTVHRQGLHQVVLYETNGCKCGEFEITSCKLTDIVIKNIIWNNDSSIFALCYYKYAQSSAKETCIELYTTSNYHWYLKQQLYFPCDILAIMWDPESAFTLHVVSADGVYKQFTWSWHTHVDNAVEMLEISSNSDNRKTCKEDKSERQALVSVIDGGRLLMTPFRYLVVPPPLCAYAIETMSPISDVVFHPLSAQCSKFLVTLSSGYVQLFDFGQNNIPANESLDLRASISVESAGGNGFTTCCPLPSHVGTLRLPCKEVFYHWIWVSNYTVMNVSANPAKPGCCIINECELNLELQQFIIRQSVEIDQRILQMSYGAGSVALLLGNGQVLDYNLSSHTVSQWLCPFTGSALSLPRVCTQMAICSFNEQPVIVALTSFHRLFVSSQEVMSNCTSFTIDKGFILLTSHNHMLRFLSRNINVKDAVAKFMSQPIDESSRRIERGSQIVCIVPSTSKLILQMPRGNLESIQPRVLVINELLGLIDRLEYNKAFELMKRHRIDLNLLSDYKPKQFLDNIALVVKQLSTANNLNLLITEWRNEDVTKTSYSAMLDLLHVNDNDSSLTEEKVDKLCDSFMTHMQEIDSNRYLISILTCCAKKQKPELEKALTLIKNARGTSECQSVDALKYLLLLIDVHKLYDVALGTYDFDIVLMVAEQSHMDPKEYIPLLESLQQLDLEYRKYTIDKHLKRYTLALKHLSEAGDEHFDELKNFVREHKLFAYSLTLYPAESDHFRALAAMYAMELVNDSHTEEAAVMFVRAEDFQNALFHFENTSNWRMSLCMAYKLNLQQEDISALARRLANRLKMSHQYIDAAHLLHQICNDEESAIMTLVDGAQWNEAFALISKPQNIHLIKSLLHPALLASYQDSCHQLHNLSSQYETYNKRLVECREKKRKQKLLYDNDASADCGDGTSIAGDSVVSESSLASSRFTGKSSRNRRKAERKKWSLKEGSSLEDLAIIEQLALLLKQMNTLSDDIQKLLPIMVMCEMTSEAQKLHSSLTVVVNNIDKSHSSIWDMENLLNYFNKQSPYEPMRPSKSNLTLQDLNQLLPPSLNSMKQCCVGFSYLSILQ